MKKYLISFDGEYLVKVPSWDNGEWTHDKTKAKVYDEDGAKFFIEYYPQFTVEEILNDLQSN